MSLRSQFSELLFMGLDIMTSAIQSTNAIAVQLGDVVSSFVDSDRAEWWQHTGFTSRPANPTKGGAACQAIGFRRGDHDIVIATKDARSSAIWQDLNPDEAQIHSFAGSCRVVCRANGKVQIPTTELDVGSLSPGDAAALASKVDSDFTTISGAASTLLDSSTVIVTTPPTNLATALSDITALATMLQTFSNAISSFNRTGSSVLKISG